MMKKNKIFFIALFVSALAQAQQYSPDVDVADSLSFMLGQWEGRGWIKMGGPQKSYFDQTEVVSSKVSGSALLVEGLGLVKDTATTIERKVHDALGMIYYDNESKSFKIMALSSAAAPKNAVFNMVEPYVLQWTFDSGRGGEVRFTEDFSDEGKWIMDGEYSMGPGNWFNFMHVELKKKF